MNIKFYGGKNPPNTTDILLITVPRRSPHLFFSAQLPEALARLKSSVEQHGYNAYCLDLDNQFTHAFIKYPQSFQKIDDYFREVLRRQYHGLKDMLLDDKTLAIYNQFLKQSVKQILDIRPKWLGISVFSEQSIRGCFDLLDELHKHNHDIKIVIGGLCMELFVEHHTIKDETLRFGEYAKKHNLVNHFIVGEGELSLPELLNDNCDYPGIDNYDPVQIDDLDALPLPDYSDFNFKYYAFPDINNLKNIIMPRITVTTSRGCIKKCTFCNVGYFWNKYRYVSPQKTFNEIIYYRKKFGVDRFNFTDSLINASLSNFKKLCEFLAEYRKQDPNIFINGQFIVRTPKEMPPEYYKLMNMAGVERISIGIESGSDKVRIDMKKKFTNDDICYTIDQCKINNIQAECLMMLGYPTETYEDYKKTVDLILKYQPEYPGDHRVVFVYSAFGMEYDWHQAPINKNPEMHNITFDNDLGWVSPCCNFYYGLKRRQAIYKCMSNLGLKNYDDFELEAIKQIKYIEDKLMSSGRISEIVPDITVVHDGTINNFV